MWKWTQARKENGSKGGKGTDAKRYIIDVLSRIRHPDGRLNLER
ncbi:hypothetical protein HanXRQr2_Chr16g0733091 [Helianthus annuus]|uniref:Uncharacterized protein n=1 Tax=Helianthus annuus TaxID=4232 RepID=A0A9K3DQ36_HELAN|nr:hypothetical protein HanXRQr2_Chr16g0733091 [Helianthus annuus]KAJ0820046.1 hypothetical protein HanPSC8_Chr16g0703191 [Helianthus annuus]